MPLVGFDAQGYRLGYGGGFFDRTLAALARRLLAIGVGYEIARLPTIRPQPHDVPMDFIVTESGVGVVRTGDLRPVPLEAAMARGAASRPAVVDLAAVALAQHVLLHLAVALRGRSATTCTRRGTLNRAMCDLSAAMTADSSRLRPGAGTTTATTASPKSGSGTPITALSATPSIASMYSSISFG